MNNLADKVAELAALMNERNDAGLAGFSDDALALRYVEQFGAEIRHVAAWHKWFQWDGGRWEQDETLRHFDQARELCRRIAQGANAGAKGIASSKTVAAVVSMSRADRRVAAMAEQWDRDPWLLNTPGGTIDLRSGAARPHDAEDYITKVTAVAPAESPIPMWMAFLETVTGGDIQLAGFLQRMVGYAITGHTSEHALFFLYGLGANGKSVFVNTITGILADYHRTSPIELLLASKQDRHPTELAGLMGRRLVTAAETDQGKRWAEAKIKRLTGGDPIAARFMRGDFFEYTPIFKLLVAGNHKPSLNTVDEAIRRRFYLVPFTVTIPTAQRDLGLTEKLKAEWPGILQWMVEGCLEWQTHKLSAPEAVLDATNEYLASQDTVCNWMSECTVEDRNTEVSSATLFGSWKEWCLENGEFPGSNKSFSQKLTDQGLESRVTNKGRMFKGRRLGF